jgi:hypothetical protein
MAACTPYRVGQEMIGAFSCINHSARQEVVDAAASVHCRNILREGGEILLAEALRPVHRGGAARALVRHPLQPVAQRGKARLVGAVHAVGRCVLGGEEVVPVPGASMRNQIAQVLKAGARRDA